MIRIGILGAADIAKRRFLPALSNLKDEYEFSGVASATNEERYAPLKSIGAENEYKEVLQDARMNKVKALADDFGGRVYESYEELLRDESVDAVYIPLPPALHFYWGKRALEAGKHVFMEKPFTVSYELTRQLVSLAEEKGLALAENYGFTYNDQIKVMEDIMSDEQKFGQLRLIRSYFGFPKRADSDFRYNKALGGGALLDCGGYTLKLARYFLGDDFKVLAATKSQMPGHDVDGWGSAMLEGRNGVTAQLSFGMDNQYKCDAEFWGSVATVESPRVFTPPPSFVPKLSFTTKDGTEYIETECGDAFFYAQRVFAACVNDTVVRDSEYWEILNQAKVLDEVLSAMR